MKKTLERGKQRGKNNRQNVEQMKKIEKPAQTKNKGERAAKKTMGKDTINKSSAWRGKSHKEKVLMNDTTVQGHGHEATGNNLGGGSTENLERNAHDKKRVQSSKRIPHQIRISEIRQQRDFHGSYR